MQVGEFGLQDVKKIHMWKCDQLLTERGGHTEFSFVAQNYVWGYILICKLIAKCFGGSLT